MEWLPPGGVALGEAGPVIMLVRPPTALVMPSWARPHPGVVGEGALNLRIFLSNPSWF